ncbi:MAG: hypothetical protein HQK54_05135 [Oligoflexales bacterium]|nr:hypothetical protein [Oligoflexales bacterium]
MLNRMPLSASSPEYSNGGNNYITSVAVKKAAGFTYRKSGERGTKEEAEGDKSTEYETAFKDSVKKFLIGFAVTEGTKVTRNVIQGEMNVTPNQFKLNSTYWVDYSGNEGYSVRVYLDGNTATNLFKLKLTRLTGTMGTSIGGYGYAKGDGKYFIFYVKQSGNSSTGAYYCFESDTTLAEVQAMFASAPDGSATVPTNCTDLAAGLPAADTLYDPNPTTSTNVPNAASDFTGKGTYGIGIN